MTDEGRIPDFPRGSVVLDNDRALRVLEEENALARSGEGARDGAWEARVVGLRAACAGASRTHIAALATALLARATSLDIDPFALKVKSGVPGAYSARRLATQVLAANAARLGIDIGVTGREPLNNQPYFRYDVIARDMDVKANAQRALNLVCDALDVLRTTTTEAEARAALRAFLRMSQRQPATVKHHASSMGSAGAFATAIGAFVAADSEGGKRAQAVAAGLLDVAFGKERILTSRINDPDRRFPGDVAIVTEEGSGPERALEVRDKAMRECDLDFMVEKCVAARVPWAGVLAVAAEQPNLEIRAPAARGSDRGVELIVFFGWRSFVGQALFWSGQAAFSSIANAHLRVFERLVEVEASEAGLETWNSIGDRIE